MPAALWAQIVPNPIPARVLGHLNRPKDLNETASPASITPNLLEGRELFRPVSVAVDTTVDPPAIYVCDTGNSRVLGWRNAAEFHNGRPADIVIGQRDFFSSSRLAPSASFLGAMTLPASVAIGPNGNLFVFDAGNNRVLRFPRPFDEANAGKLHTPDLIIGQRTRTGRNPNQSTATNATPDATTLKTSYSGATLLTAMVFDPAGNLWLTDPGNHRVLRYARDAVTGPGNIQSNGSIDPVIAANRVLGQIGMELSTPNPGLLSNAPSGQVPYRLRKDQILGGGALAFDSQGNLYFADDMGRVLFYRAPFDFDGKPADRILGIVTLFPGQSAPPLVNETGIGFQASGNRFTEGARGLFCIGDVPFVVDTLNSRILRFPVPSEWPNESTEYSPRALGVIGQADFNSGIPNRWYTWEPTSRSLRNPSAAIFAANQVWVADTENHRVIAFPNLLEAGDNAAATKLLGQVGFEFRAANFIQGREFASGSLPVVAGGQIASLAVGPGAALDQTGDTPRLYIADTGNNRILGFADARRAKQGDFADLVIGQVDFYRNLVNSPFNDASKPTADGLNTPSSVAVDSEGNLWVADTGNARVLRYPRPYDDPAKRHTPDLVIGQLDPVSVQAGEPTSSNLLRPVAIAFTMQGQLIVSDLAHNRVLRFDPPFFTGMDAALVIGQPNFTSSSSGNDATKLALPMGVAVDTDDRLYVADSVNNRVAVFDRVSAMTVNGLAAGTPIQLTSGSMQPISVTIDRNSGELWVSDARNSLVRRFNRYPLLIATLAQTGSMASSLSFSAAGPRSITLDKAGNLYVTDSVSRLTMHFPQLLVSNWSNGFFRLAPGLVSRIRTYGVKLASEAVSSDAVPAPKELAGLEILVNGTPAPLFSISTDAGDGVAKVQLPSNSPTVGFGEIIVRNKETDQILAHQIQLFDRASPAFVVTSPPGGGQIKATNQDGSANTAANPAPRGTEITLSLIGYGELETPPEDGAGSSNSVPVDGILYIGACTQGSAIVPCEAAILSSQLDPQRPGEWIIKARLPSTVTGLQSNEWRVPVTLVYRSMATNSYSLNGQNVVISTTVAVRP